MFTETSLDLNNTNTQNITDLNNNFLSEYQFLSSGAYDLSMLRSEPTKANNQITPSPKPAPADVDVLTGTRTTRPNISIRDITVKETDSKEQVINVRVVLDKPSDKRVAVRYSTIEDAAVAGKDFEAKEGRIVFRPGQTQRNIKITIIGNNTKEITEAFGIGLEKPRNARIEDSIGIITIVDDELEGSLIEKPSGLEYSDLRRGKGATPKQGETVVVDYVGTFSNGVKFDSSLDRGEPITFTFGTGQVIAGWDEGLADMRPGGRRILVIPPELAYGADGIPGSIPPNATLNFEVRLLEIQS